MSTKKTGRYFRELRERLKMHGVIDNFINTLSDVQKSIFELKTMPNNLSNEEIGGKIGMNNHQSVSYQLDLIDQTAKAMLSMPMVNNMTAEETPPPPKPEYYEVTYTMLAAALVASGEEFPEAVKRVDGQVVFRFNDIDLSGKEVDFHRNALMVDARNMSEAYKSLINKIHETKSNFQRAGF